MARSNVTIRLESETIARLDGFAVKADRDRSYLIKEAIDRYLELKQWQSDEVNKALAEADTGNFVPDAEMDQLIAKWTR